MKAFFIVCFAVSLLGAYGIKDLPKDIPRCSRSDKNLNKCIAKALETVRPYLKKGIPQINLPSFDPLSFTEVVVEQGTQALNFKATLKNGLIYGLSEYKCSKFE
ncbi:hypothetical protein JTB14_037630 [Gonioctena quinquepunctata]|nr:hypothetical protein JTB14_037630 [Gonioctena quinquepunctata]